jgi:poly-gamma-glutamate synthesis protein (capsule biosynthesis protein)
MIIGADVAPAADRQRFEGGTERMTSGLRSVWEDAHVRLFSLSLSVADKNSVCGQSGKTRPMAFDYAKDVAALKPAAVSLCCPHVLDGGEEALRTALASLKSAGIAYFGAGVDLDEAGRPYYFLKNKLRIGVYAAGEHGSHTASERSPGANPLEPLDLGDCIRDIRRSCDRLIVFYRGGDWDYPYPSPNTRKICRKIAEYGASIVVCRQGPAVGCYEKWDNATIVYGQGAFLPGQDDPGAEGMLVSYEIGDYGAEQVSFLPVETFAEGVRLAEGERAREIMEAFEARSRRIRVQGFVEARFRMHIAENREHGTALHTPPRGGKVRRMLYRLLYKRTAYRKTEKMEKLLLGTIESDSALERLAEGLRGSL